MHEAPDRTAFRESFRVAEAAVTVLAERRPDGDGVEAVWEAFDGWTGRGDAAYLQGMRSGGKFIFYGLLQDIYAFAEATFGEDLTEQFGRKLADDLLARHMPDILQTTLARPGTLVDQLPWLLERFLAGATGEVYALEFTPEPAEGRLSLTVGYRHEAEVADYLRRSGHNPERAFERSYHVMRGALLALLDRVMLEFHPDQLDCELRGLQGRFGLALSSRNRFHYEGLIETLLHYVGRLRERKQLVERPPLDADVPLSAAMADVVHRIRRAAASDETVLLSGESGTGKNYYARIIHERSARREGPFVDVSLTADVGSDNMIQSNLFGHVRGAYTGADEEKQGLFALADGGTIFLDEIGDASAELQAKLLRVIETKRFRLLGGTADVAVDVRVVAATHRDLAAMVRDGAFRQDLYFRLNVIEVHLPPLRDRPEDLPGLVQSIFEFVCRTAARPGQSLSAEALAALCAYGWPGNIRELENALRHAVAFAEGDEAGVGDLPAAVRAAAGQVSGAADAVVNTAALERALAAGAPGAEAQSFEWPGHVDHARREYLRTLIRHHRGNLRAIAAHWDRSSENTLRKLIAQFGLQEELRAARQAAD